MAISNKARAKKHRILKDGVTIKVSLKEAEMIVEALYAQRQVEMTRLSRKVDDQVFRKIENVLIEYGFFERNK